MDFVERKLAFVEVVVKVQGLYRRRGPIKFLKWLKLLKSMEPAMATRIQRFWRHRAQRIVINKFLRMKRLLQYKVCKEMGALLCHTGKG